MPIDDIQELEAADDAKAKQAATTVKYIFVGILFAGWLLYRDGCGIIAGR